MATYGHKADVNTIEAPFPASTAVEPDDLLYWNSTAVAKASAQSDQGSETLNQRLFASLFIGLSADKRLSTETSADSRTVRTDIIVKMTCPSDTYEVGDLVAASENGSGDALLDQQIEKTTDPSLAIGYCVKREGSAVTSVWVRLIGRYTPNVIRAPYFDAGSSDVLFIGSSLPQTVSDGDGTTNLSPNVQILGTAKASASLLIGSWNTTNDNTVGPTLAFLKSGNAAIGSNTVVASGENLGEILWFGADGTDFESAAAAVRCEVDNTPGAGDMPGRLVFLTTADGGETLTERLRIDSVGKVYVNDSADANMTIGLCINQAGNDDFVFSLKSSDVSHGTTTLAETDTYGFGRKIAAADGGLEIAGISDVTRALQLYGVSVTEDTTDAPTTSSLNTVTVRGGIKSGTTTTTLGATGNLFAAQNNDGTNEFVVKGDGELYSNQSATVGTFDDHDDAIMCADLSYVLSREYSKVVNNNRDQFERLGILGPLDEKGQGMYSLTKLTMLTLCAIGQLGRQIATLAQYAGLKLLPNGGLAALPATP